MLVWLVQLGEPLPLSDSIRKQRLSLLSEALVKKGHSVVRWASDFDHITKSNIHGKDQTIELQDNLTIETIYSGGYKNNISISRFINHFQFEKKLLKRLNEIPEKPDMILVCTPPPGLACKIVKYANRYNIPVLLDVRDQWPDIIVDRIPKALQKFSKILFYKEFKKMQIAAERATGITAMMSDLLDWGLEYAGRKKTDMDDVFYIGTNKAVPQNIDLIRESIKKQIDNVDGKIVFTFIGTFSNFYNPIDVVKVAKKIEVVNKDIAFILAGNGNTFEEVKEAASGANNVTMLDWLNHEEITYLLSKSNVGICPLKEDRPCFPNKIFIYLSAYLPVITSTKGEFYDILTENNLGRYYPPNNEDVLYGNILEMADAKKREEMKDNVYQIFDDKFNAENIYDKFVVHMEKVANNYKSRS
jgi:glycosyltransferase involved in cell wall biosynthesis